MVGAAPKDRPKLSVVIPVYNERATIEEILQRVQAVDIDKEIIIVDDGSEDGTRELLEELARARKDNRWIVTLPLTQYSLPMVKIRIFFNGKNCGKGAAVRRGFQEACGEIVLIQDADLELDPQDYRSLLAPIEEGLADVVYGSRFLEGSKRFSFWHYMGNRLLTIMSNALTKMNLSDIWTGYKVFSAEVLKTLKLRENRFGFELEVTAKVAKGGWRVFEVPVAYAPRSHAHGKKIKWRDGLKGIWWILRYNLLG